MSRLDDELEDILHTATTAEVLLKVAAIMERWAQDTVDGGWSTHQLQAQRRLARTLKVRVALF